MPRRDAHDFKFDKEMEELGEQMVKHCGGLPLAIKVLGGLLAEKYTPHDWKILSDNIGSHLVGVKTDINEDNDNSCNYILSLSYEELPSHLKHCFLYLAHFQEDHIITARKLSYLWAAEGIFIPRFYSGENIRDIGDSYIEELVKRNMVIAERSEVTLRYNTCQLHDMMRDVCLFKAKEENFLQFISNHLPTANFQYTITSRRCVSYDPTTLHFERDLNNPKIRSLMVLLVKEDWKSSWKLSSSGYTRLELLRVLDLSKANFGGKSLASGIGKLIHLRYLSLENAKVSHLPCSLENLKLLIYLNIEIVGSIFVPNVFMGMQELRYLALPRIMDKKTKIELSNQVNLETLRHFSTKSGSLEDIRGMVKLRNLAIKLTEETSMKTISASIGGLRYLETLDIWFSRRIEDEIVFDFAHLKMLCIRELPRLPKEHHFPSCITVLILSSCWWEEDPMPILGKLDQLKVMRLYNKSCFGRRMVCSSSGFPKLQTLELLGLENLEEWIVEDGSMPFLHTLYILRCPKLKEFPHGLRFITFIKELITDEKWKERLSEGGHEFYKVKHIPSVVFF